MPGSRNGMDRRRVSPAGQRHHCAVSLAVARSAASSLASWCSSTTISALACAAALGAKRRSARPDRELGGYHTLRRSPAPAPCDKASRVHSRSFPITHGLRPARTPSAFDSAVSGVVKSTTTSASGRTSSSAVPRSGSAPPELHVLGGLPPPRRPSAMAPPRALATRHES